MHTLDSTLTLAQTLPEGGSIPLILVLVAGLLLWLAGDRVIKPVFFIFGLAIGGFVGTTLVPFANLPTFHPGGLNLTPGITGLIVGGILGSLVALAMFRMVIAATSGMAFAAAGIMGAMIFLSVEKPNEAPLSEGESSMVDAGDSVAGIATSLNDTVTREAAEIAVDMLDGDGEILTEEAKDNISNALERSRIFLSHIGDTIKADLDTRSDREKFIITSAGFAGLAFGLLLGVTMPSRTTALVTSLFGSAVCIAATSALLTARSGHPPAYLDQSAITLATIWIILTVLGLMAQLGFLSKVTNKSRPRTNDDNDDDE